MPFFTPWRVWVAHSFSTWLYVPRSSSVKDSSVIAVQIFDQRKFKRRDQGFLGVVNIPVRDHLDMDVGGQGEYFTYSFLSLACLYSCIGGLPCTQCHLYLHRNAHS